MDKSHNKLCASFFDECYQTPEFIKQQNKTEQHGRRNFLKSAAGVSSMSALASLTPLHISAKTQSPLTNLIKTDPWLTLDATLNQLLPNSDTGPSAKDIRATAYLHQVMTVQPTEQEEKAFILKGVSWLNDYANSQKSASFSQLNHLDKEALLQGISQSRAGRNWLNTLLNYIFQAMLAPQSYGGNPNGIGWQWLEHQAGFPLPEKGQRYFELPSRARIDLISSVSYNKKRKAEKNQTKNLAASPKKPLQGITKA